MVFNEIDDQISISSRRPFAPKTPFKCGLCHQPPYSPPSVDVNFLNWSTDVQRTGSMPSSKRLRACQRLRTVDKVNMYDGTYRAEPDFIGLFWFL